MRGLDSEAVEKSVFSSLGQRKIPNLKEGFFFRGDQPWAGLDQNIKAPDIIFMQDIGHKIISIRPYEIKCSPHHVKLGQISPLTLVSLYANDHFHACLESNMDKRGWKGYHLCFEEGAFIIPEQKDEIGLSEDGLYRIVMSNVTKHQLDQKRRKVDDFKKRLGYFPFTVFLLKAENGQKELLNNVPSYGCRIDTNEFSVNTLTKSYAIYVQNPPQKIIYAPIIEVALP